jgi:hypothetical protein
MRYRVHVWPWTRPLAGRVLPSRLAISLGRQVIAWRALDEEELTHELEQVRQWQAHGLVFPIAYLVASLRARGAGGHWYTDNRYEVAAREAAARRRS